MRYAKKSPMELQHLRRTLCSRLAQEQPEVAQAARWIREALGLNQRDFAKLVGLSTPQVARLERGEANPTLETLMAVGKPFGLRIGFISPEPSPPLQLVSPTLPVNYELSLRSTPTRQVTIPPLNFSKKK